MKKVTQKQNIFFQWVFWQFFEMPRNILKVWRDFLRFYLNYFSVSLLIKTFFSHWRQYKWSYGRGFDIGRYLEAFLSNLISRALGAIFRSFLIVIGIFIEILIFFGGAIIFIVWFVLPILIFWGLWFGIKIVL